MLCSPQVGVAFNDMRARAERAEADAERAEADAERWSALAKSNAAAGNRTEDERFNLYLENKQLRAENAQLKQAASLSDSSSCKE